jgi:hypothetical protein
VQGKHGYSSDVIEGGFRPGTRGQVGDGANIQVIPERRFGCFAHCRGVARKTQNDLIDELGARKPFQIADTS